MSDFEQVLDDCLESMARGEASIEECLARYPEHATQLRPLLQVAARLGRVRDVRPSPSFQTLNRARLITYLRTHPRRNMPTLSLVRRLVISLAMLVLVFLFGGTALAQGALPGDPLYGWKRTSEEMWYAVWPDRLGTELALANRRARELLAVYSDATRRAQALEGYRAVLIRLKSQNAPIAQTRILETLRNQQAMLSQSGIVVPELEEFISGGGAPPPVLPRTTPTSEPPLPTPMESLPIPTPIIPLPTIELPLLP